MTTIYLNTCFQDFILEWMYYLFLYELKTDSKTQILKNQAS